MTDITVFEVRKDDLSNTRITTAPAPELSDGEVLMKVDRFAFTANNITYGVVGERIGYWKFFPVKEEGWGIIPVWGFADIVESKNPEAPVGDRLYGYFPMATHLVMQPDRIKETRLSDGASHRADLPPVYNNYARVKNEASYDTKLDDERMVLFPLYATSYCLYDFFMDNDWYGAKQLIIPSASSKTAIGTAYAIKSDEAPPALVGLTSPRNFDDVVALGLYDTVLRYDQLDEIDAGAPTAIIDMSGNGKVLGALHKRLGDNMVYTSNVGLTHYDANSMGEDFIRERSAMFFAPGHIQKRTKEWGPGEFEKKAAAFWLDATLKSRKWLEIRREDGAEAVTKAYEEVRAGKTPASVGWVVGF